MLMQLPVYESVSHGSSMGVFLLRRCRCRASVSSANYTSLCWSF